MADADHQQFLEVQVIPGTPPPPNNSALLSLQIPTLSGINITRQQSSPLWTSESDSYGFDLAQFGDESLGNFSDDIPGLAGVSTSFASLSPASPASSTGYSPLLDSFPDFSISSSSPVVASPQLIEGTDVPLPFNSSFDQQFTWPNNHNHKGSNDFLSPTSIFAPSPQRSYHSPSSSYSDLGSDPEPSGSTSLVRRHSHSMSQDRGFDQLRHTTQQLPLRRARSISVVRSKSPYDRHDGPVEFFVPSPPRSPAPPFPEPEIPDFTPKISITDASDESDESSPTPGGSQRDTIASAAVLRASEKRRTKKANFKCHVCGNCLTSKDNLNNHIDAHNNVRRHECDHCGDRFRTRSVLRRHQNSNKCKSRVKCAPNTYVGKLHC